MRRLKTSMMTIIEMELLMRTSTKVIPHLVVSFKFFVFRRCFSFIVLSYIVLAFNCMSNSRCWYSVVYKVSYSQPEVAR